MKLLVFSPAYPPYIGGLESHAEEFNTHLAAQGVTVTIFTSRLPAETLEKEIGENGVIIIRFPAFEIVPNYPLPKFWGIKFWRLFFGLFKEKFDIVISRTRFFNTSLLALTYAKMKRVRWIHIEHGSDFISLNNRLSSLIAKLYDYTLGKLVLSLSDLNIANSNASAEFCRKLAPRKKCEVIYRGVEIEKIINIEPDSNLKEKYKNDIIISFTGRLIDGKGVSDLIEAVSLLEAKNIKCFIVGDGPQRKNLERKTRHLKIEDRIVFFGSKKIEEVIAILKISDIFVNPSYSEGLPTSVIEAALCQKAIIATDVGGTKEIIIDQKNGFLIKPHNIESLRKKLYILAENQELREELGKNAYIGVKEKFNWENSILKYLNIFDKINGNIREV